MRVGGDWVVAFAVYDRKDRDIFRTIIGSEVVFVLLDLDKDLLKERLSRRRQGEGRRFARLRSRFEKVRAGEPRTVSHLIEDDASAEENVDAVLQLIKRFETKKNLLIQVGTLMRITTTKTTKTTTTKTTTMKIDSSGNPCALPTVNNSGSCNEL